MAAGLPAMVAQRLFLYSFRVGLSALLVSTNRAMRRPLHCGTGNRTGSTFFMLLGEDSITNPQPSGSLAAQMTDGGQAFGVHT